MTDDTNKNGPDANVVDEALEATAIENDAPEQSEPDPIDVLKAENADLRDKFLRLAAEMDNLRRRTEREVKDAKAYSVAGFARDMLAVSDNLRRALDTIPEELKTNSEAGIASLIRRRRHDGALDAVCAGASRRAQDGCGRREVRPELPSGDV